MSKTEDETDEAAEEDEGDEDEWLRATKARDRESRRRASERMWSRVCGTSSGLSLRSRKAKLSAANLRTYGLGCDSNPT